MRMDRIEKIINSMRRCDMDQMVISDPSTTFYLTGKSAASGARLLALCLNTQGACTLSINPLQTDHAPLVEDARIVWCTDSNDSIQILAKKIRTGGAVGIDRNWPSSFLLRLMATIDTKYVLNSRTVDYTRMIKGDGETQLMCGTQAVNERIISEVSQYISPELTEQKRHRMPHRIYRAHDVDGYNTIGVVAYGKSRGYAHHKLDGTTPVAGDCIIIDAGTRLNGYRFDMTYTAFYKSVSDEMGNAYEVVKEAQLITMGAIKPGMRFCDIDKIGHDIVTKYGYGECFTHRIGHNIGIDGHEFPGVRGVNTMEILSSMTLFVESGIYIPNLGGVRIEDLVAITEDGYECLNKMSRNLRIIQNGL